MKLFGNHNKDYLKVIIHSTNQQLALRKHDHLQDLGINLFNIAKIGYAMNRTKIFDELGGLETIHRVHKIFYDKVYAHPWMSRFFKNHDQTHIANQQTDFMAERFGGPKAYVGQVPNYAHNHIFITEKLFNTRQAILKESLEEAGITPRLIESWLFVDNAFRQQVVNKDYKSFKEVETYKGRIVVSENKDDIIF